MEAEERIAYRYTSDAPEGAEPQSFIPGVPLRSLTVADVEALPAHLRASVAASPLYVRTRYAPDEPAPATAGGEE